MKRAAIKTCEIGDELGIQYLLAVEQEEDAERDLDHSVTITQKESAATRLGRLQGHKLWAMGELAGHCLQHGCVLPVLDKPLLELVLSHQALASTLETGSGSGRETAA